MPVDRDSIKAMAAIDPSEMPTLETEVAGRKTPKSTPAVDPGADGQETVWETDAGFGKDISSAQLVEKDGVLFYGTKNGLLLALDGATGAIKWKHRVGVALLNTVTPISCREVVVTDLDGHVTCLASGR